MPQFNNYEIKNGTIIDPTFGLASLDAVSKRKTKEREQMNTVAQILRQALASKGMGISSGTTATVSGGGTIEFANPEDEKKLYDVGYADYGKSGTGISSTTVNDTTSQKEAESKFKSDVNGIISSRHQSVPTDPLIQRAVDIAVSNKAQNPAAEGSPVQTTDSSKPAPSINTPPAVAPPTPSVINPTHVSSGQSISTTKATTDQSNYVDSVQYSGQNMATTTTKNDIMVPDRLHMNYSDLRVAAAMESIAGVMSGTNSPGTYNKLMTETENVMKATREAWDKQGTAVSMAPSNQFGGNRHIGTENRESDSETFSNSKQQAQAAREKDPTQRPGYWNPSGEFTDADVRNNRVVFDKDRDRTAMIMDPRALALGDNLDKWIKNFNTWHKNANNPFYIKDDGLVYIKEGGKERAVGMPKSWSSTAAINKFGQTFVPIGVDGKPVNNIIAIDFFPGDVSLHDFNLLTAQKIGSWAEKHKTLSKTNE